jgi:hypothetical protein
LAAPGARGQERSRTAGDLLFLYDARDQGLADALAAVAVSFRPPVLPPGVLEGEPRIHIHLANDEAAFDSLTGGRAPDWGAGVAFPGSGVIVLPAYASSRAGQHALGQVLMHELAHLALQRYLGPAQVPHWFSEGYATWSAGQFDESAGWLLRLAFLTGRAPPLDSLALEWPAGAVDARVAYLLSASAVTWLHANGGDRAFGIFLERWRVSRHFEGALRATYGLTIGQLETWWARSVRRRYGWLLFVAQSAVIWALTGLLVLVLVIIRRRRDRLRLERLRATEPPDDPAYWLEGASGEGETGGPGSGKEDHATPAGEGAGSEDATRSR